MSTVVDHTGSELASAELPVLVIGPRAGWKTLALDELWKYRELLFFLTWRDVKVRYKQTLLGAAWAVLQPLMMMIVFTVFLGRLAGVSSGEFPYPLFVFAGLLPWSFFSTAIANAGNSVVGAERLITKVYFPRLAVPFAAVAAALLDFLIALGMLLAMMLWYGVRPGPQLVWMPLALALISLAALGTGSLLAALNVAYRDFRYVIPFLVQVWMFATPTIYLESTPGPSARPSAADREATTGPSAGASAGAKAGQTPSAETPPATDRAREAWGPVAGALLGLNPLTGLIAFFRASVLGGPLPWGRLASSGLLAGAMFAVGCLYFRRVEDTFADVI